MDQLRELLKRVKVASPKQLEEADYVVCGEIPFDDRHDVKTLCVKCGVTIWHRPFQPRSVKKICLKCMLLDVAAENGKLKKTEDGNESMADGRSAGSRR